MRLALVLALWLATVTSSNAVTVTFVIDPSLWSEIPRILMYEDGDDQNAEDVPFVDGRASIEFNDEETWRFQPTFLIRLPERRVEGTIVHGELDLELPMSIKRTLGDIDIPITPARGIGSRELTRIETLSSVLFFDKLLQAQTLAVHFDATIPQPTAKFTKRMARVWFDTMFDAVTGRQFAPGPR